MSKIKKIFSLGVSLAAVFIFIFLISGCATTGTSQQATSTQPDRGVSFTLNVNAVQFNCLKEDISVRLRVANALGYYNARSHSDIGSLGAFGRKEYSTRYNIDEALLGVAFLVQKCFKLVPDTEANVPFVQFFVGSFSGETFLDARPANDRDWIIYNTWKLTLVMRLIDPSGNIIAEFSSPQSLETQIAFPQRKSLNYTVNTDIIERMLVDALNDLFPKFLSDPKVRAALKSSGGPAGMAKELILKAEEAEKNNDLQTAFNLYMQVLSEGPLNQDIIVKIIGISKGLKSAPVISEEARKQAAYGKAALDLAKDESGYFNAIQEYQKAIRLAPWWVDLYMNTALIMEKAGLYSDAAEYLKLYLLISPKGADTEKIKTRLYELEYKAKQREEKSKEKKGPVTIYI